MQFKMTKTFAWADEADKFESRVSGEVERENETTVSWYEHVPMLIAVWDKVSDPETQLKRMIDVINGELVGTHL